jgi:hypothetical protein
VPETTTPTPTGTPVRCRHCGTRGLRIDNHNVINPGPGEVLALCPVRAPLRPGGPLAPHGPWDREEHPPR